MSRDQRLYLQDIIDAIAYVRSFTREMIHEYFGVDSDILWDVISNHLDPLDAATKRLMAQANDLDSQTELPKSPPLTATGGQGHAQS